MIPIQQLLMLAGAGSGIAGALQGSNVSGEGWEKIPGTSIEASKEARRFLESLYKTPIHYPTQQVAGMSEAELTGQDLLSQFLGEGPSPERASALSFLTGLLDMPRDIMQLPEIKALLSSIKSVTADLINSVFRRTQLEGMGTSGPQGSAVGRELAKGQTSMVAALAPYLSQARSNQLSAASLINSLVSSAEGSALGKIGAASTYGALPRELEQAGYSADWQKKVNDILAKFNLQMPAAQSVYGQPTYAYSSGMVQPNPLTTIGSSLGGLGLSLSYMDYLKNIDSQNQKT